MREDKREIEFLPTIFHLIISYDPENGMVGFIAVGGYK